MCEYYDAFTSVLSMVRIRGYSLGVCQISSPSANSMCWSSFVCGSRAARIGVAGMALAFFTAPQLSAVILSLPLSWRLSSTGFTCSKTVSNEKNVALCFVDITWMRFPIDADEHFSHLFSGEQLGREHLGPRAKADRTRRSNGDPGLGTWHCECWYLRIARCMLLAITCRFNGVSFNDCFGRFKVVVFLCVTRTPVCCWLGLNVDNSLYAITLF